MQHGVSVVILDLDNTLYDWVDIWHRSFEPMLEELIRKSGVSRDQLIADFKTVFTNHKTTEYSFAIEELSSLRERHSDEDLSEVYASAIKAYQAGRNAATSLYPGVLETLRILRAKGCLLVGYTESMAFYTSQRIRKLGLDGILDYLYSPPDHDFLAGVAASTPRRYEPYVYELKHTVHRHTPRDETKPSPGILLAILRELGATKDETIYIGDNLVKDVRMAQLAGVTDVWAAYGCAHERPEYDLLRRVTHWSDAAVQKEQQTRPEHVRPSYKLEVSLNECLEKFRFAPYAGGLAGRSTEVIELWKKTIDVQQHFNDLELRIRNYALLS